MLSEINLQQRYIIQNIKTYLIAKGQKENADNLATGYCNGLGILFIFAKIKNLSNKGQFENYTKLLNRVVNASEKDIKAGLYDVDFEKLFAQIEWSQRSFQYVPNIAQKDISDIVDSSLIREHFFAATIDSSNSRELEEIFESRVKLHRPIIFSQYNHAQIIYKDEDGIWFYDSNHKKLIRCSSIKDLANEFLHTFKNKYVGKHVAIGFSVYRTENQSPATYPSLKQFLKTHPEQFKRQCLYRNKNDNKMIKKVHFPIFLMAVRFKDKNTINYLLEQKKLTPMHLVEMLLTENKTYWLELLKDLDKTYPDIFPSIVRNTSQTADIIANMVANGDVEGVQFLVDKGFSIHAIDAEKKTPLHVAANKLIANTELIDYLIQSGLDVNQPDINGSTPLFYAVAKGNIEAVRHLIKCGADVHHKNKNNDDLFLLAMSNQYYDIAKLLMTDLNLYLEDDKLRQKLIDSVFPAASLGRTDIIRIMAENGVPLDTPSRDAASNIFHFSALSGSSEVFKEIEQIYNEAYQKQTTTVVPTDELLKAKNIFGYTPLFYAANNFNLMKYLTHEKKVNPWEKGQHITSVYLENLIKKPEIDDVSVNEFVDYFYSFNPKVEELNQIITIFNRKKLTTIPPQALAIQQAILAREKSYNPQSYATRTLKERFPQNYLSYKANVPRITEFSAATMLTLAGFVGVALLTFLGVTAFMSLGFFVPFIPLAITTVALLTVGVMAYLIGKSSDKYDSTPFNLPLSIYNNVTNFFGAVSRFFRSSYQRLPNDVSNNISEEKSQNETATSVLETLKKHSSTEESTLNSNTSSETKMPVEHFSKVFNNVNQNVTEAKNPLDISSERKEESSTQKMIKNK